MSTLVETSAVLELPTLAPSLPRMTRTPVGAWTAAVNPARFTPVVADSPVGERSGVPAGEKLIGGVASNVEEGVDREVVDRDLADIAHAAAPTPRRLVATARRQQGLVLTSRDILTLQFLARYKYATYPQLGAYLDMAPDALRRRLPRLAAEGVLAFKSVGKTSKVWVPTKTGITLSGLDLTVPETSLGTANHSLALVDLGIWFEQGGERVVTEREIRAADVRGKLTERMIEARSLIYPDIALDELAARVDGPPLFSALIGSGEAYMHIPDMVIVRPPAEDGSPGSIAIELELRRKARSAWKRVFAAYASSPNVGLVVYYTHRRDLATALTSTIKDMGLDYMIKVKKYTASDHSPVLNEDD